MPEQNRTSRLFNLANRIHARNQSNASHQPLASETSSPARSNFNHRTSFDQQSTYSDPFANRQQSMANMDDPTLHPPIRPFSEHPAGETKSSSRRSSFSSDKYKESTARPPSLSINYVPAKFTRLHAPGDWAHRKAKQGGGRDAFAKNASRMGMVGTVDDDEGVVFQLGKGGLKKKKPKLRWNRFKWTLFLANSLVCHGDRPS
jgi:hypothetical protein